MRMQRIWAMPAKDTFDCQPIGDFVRRYLRQSSISIDPFARNKRWATHTNDLNPNTIAEYHTTALEFLKMLHEQQVRADLVIFDPPYSLMQCKMSYENVGLPVGEYEAQHWGRWDDEKALIYAMLDIDGVFLHFGWHSNGLGKKYLSVIEEILLVAHGTAHNDTICMAERKIAHQVAFSAAEEG